MPLKKFKCRLCNSEKLDFFLMENNYKLYRCSFCKVVSIYPQPTKIELEKFNKNKYNSLQNKKAYFSAKNKLYERARLDDGFIKKFKPRGILLDVGCSYGFYLDVFGKSGFQVQGIELAPIAIKYARNKLRLNILKGDVMTYKFSKRYDIITLYEIIEHIPSPNALFKRIKKLSKSNALLVIQTPNINSVYFKLTGNKWFWLLVPQHINLFSVQSLKILLKNHGFQILFTRTWDDYDELVKNILFVLRLKDKGKSKILYFLGYKLLWLFSPLSSLWSKFGYGGELTLFAQKIN
ncbi:hypothetical protein A3I80_01205 [Candidatus Gottesmanbacteria bacterium RIFCSPLOWO2_02_FULL_40_10]|nr:MAG: hypothetical protein A3I80_01205 [Candidatus Gottesmanbacteria bacterium RIFCSPLOWO2_02_FULL_40_10]